MEELDAPVESAYKTLSDWWHHIIELLPSLAVALLVVVVFYLIGRLLKRLMRIPIEKTFKDNLSAARVVTQTLFMGWLLLGVSAALSILDVTKMVNSLFAGAGVIGIVAGFALKDVVANVFAGLMISFNRPIREKQYISVADCFGTVTEINLVNTVIKTLDGEQVFIPNQIIYNQIVTNYSRYGTRRVTLTSGVSYGDNLDQVKKVALDTVKSLDCVVKNKKVDFYYSDIGGSSYNFEVRYWVKFKDQTDYLKGMSDGIAALKKAFEENDISIPYPVQTLDFGVKGGENLKDQVISINQNSK